MRQVVVNTGARDLATPVERDTALAGKESGGGFGRRATYRQVIRDEAGPLCGDSFVACAHTIRAGNDNLRSCEAGAVASGD
jgi:hypothetical protein